MNICIVGATHGNEWTGKYVLDQLDAHAYKNLSIEKITANPEAYKLNRRFIDEDLNRAFETLDQERETVEYRRAVEIAKSVKKSKFVIDMHTTTSNMGVTIIITHKNELNFRVAHAIASKMAHVKVLYSSDEVKRKYLASQIEHGLMIEVGPCAQSLRDPRIILQTHEMLTYALEFLNDPTSGSFDQNYYLEEEDIYYPEGMMIHPKFQNSDWELLLPGDPIFCNLKGEIIKWEGKKTHPVFINEAAYYPSNLAFSTTSQHVFKS